MKFDYTNQKKKVYCIDVDGTLTNGEMFWKCEPTPNMDMIEWTNEKYEEGNIIIIWTARQWRHAQETVAWLIKYGVPYHGLQMAKGGADYYVDDKAVELSTLYKDIK